MRKPQVAQIVHRAKNEIEAEFPYKKELTKGLPGRFVYLQPLTFGAVKLAMVMFEDPLFTPESWDYPSAAMAITALINWDGDGEPMSGWTRRTDLTGNFYPEKEAS